MTLIVLWVLAVSVFFGSVAILAAQPMPPFNDGEVEVHQGIPGPASISHTAVMAAVPIAMASSHA